VKFIGEEILEPLVGDKIVMFKEGMEAFEDILEEVFEIGGDEKLRLITCVDNVVQLPCLQTVALK